MRRAKEGIRQRERDPEEMEAWRGTPCEGGGEEEDQRNSVRLPAICLLERGYIHLQYGVEGSESNGNRMNLGLRGSL